MGVCNVQLPCCSVQLYSVRKADDASQRMTTYSRACRLIAATLDNLQGFINEKVRQNLQAQLGLLLPPLRLQHINYKDVCRYNR